MLALVAAATPAVTGTGGASASDTGSLLKPAAPTDVRLRSAPRNAERTRLVTINDAQLAKARVGDRLTLDLFADTSVTTVVEARTRSGGTTTWTGQLAGTAGSFVGAQVDGVAHFNVTTPQGSYQVTQAGGDTYRVTESGPAQFGKASDVAPAIDVPDNAYDSLGRAGRTTRSARKDAGDQIDVAIVYPPALATQVGASALQAQFQLAIAQTNEAFTNSDINAKVRLVGSRAVTPPDTIDLFAALRQLSNPSDGVYDEAHALREETHADLVSLWLPGTVALGSSCGIGSLGGLDPARQSESAAWTAVYAAECATDYRVFAHELGHNLGGNHDVGAAQPPTDGKPYARGYVDVAAGTITVMAYYDACARAGVKCVRIGYFSNPNVKTPSGRVTGTTEANNALAMSEQIPAVANYRQEQIYPGTVEVAGAARARSKLTARATGWAPGNVTFNYQWLVDGVAEPGATDASFTPSLAHIGHTVSVQVLGAAPYYASVPLTSTPVTIGNAVFATSAPRLAGTARVGSTLRASIKGWKPKPTSKNVVARYTWYRNGKKIKGAKGTRYRVKRKDRGNKISLRLTTSATGYDTAARTSRAITIR